ncbi:MAG: FAD:protein FMN transferase [Rhodobacteraceae bacterium]|nr:FAD:protein FMN transferase [Paracoccaceae bacterium]
MTTRLTRRRFFSVTAAAILLPDSARASKPIAQWRGTALGAAASMQLTGLETGQAQALFSEVRAEISRLEQIFSLYRQDSVLSRLNRKGHITDPPAELVELLSLSVALFRATDGRFDPTIQPLWEIHAQQAANGGTVSDAQILDALEKTGAQNLSFDAKSIVLGRQGMALTLNGIAQGYFTDKVAALLRRRGMENILIDVGEIAALGRKPDNTQWRVGIAQPDGEIVERIELEDRALASSAPLGTILGSQGHIIDPITGRPGLAHRLVSVSAPTAALADGLSTAFAILPEKKISQSLEQFPMARLEVLK